MLRALDSAPIRFATSVALALMRRWPVDPVFRA
jgi:hypothetical protein